MLWTPYWLASVVTLLHVGEVAGSPRGPVRGRRRRRSAVDCNDERPRGPPLGYEQLPYWGGEVEECINGRTVADGVYFGVDMSPLVERLVGERQPDGGWNSEWANGWAYSSFHSITDALDGLIPFERTSGGTPQSREARAAGESHLLGSGWIPIRDTSSRSTGCSPSIPPSWVHSEIWPLSGSISQ